MQNKITDIKKTINSLNQIIFSLDGNHSISKIKLTNNINMSDLKIEYAQNGVTTDLIPLQGSTFKTTKDCFIEFDTALFASDIYLFSSDKSDISAIEAELFEDRLEFSDAYPKCIDKALDDNYYLEEVAISSKGKGKLTFSLYSSLDDINYSFISRHINCEVGKTIHIPVKNINAGFVRVFLEYCSNYDDCIIIDIKAIGKKNDTVILEVPQVKTSDFCNCEYNVNVTPKDTINELYGIVERNVGEKYKDWFVFELSENPRDGHQFDFFELKNCNNMIHIKGNTGVSIATGLNYYLKYYCKVNISQVGNQVRMPDKIVLLNETIFKETKAKIRYAYNYCTLSYSMAFWGEKEWRKELDWLALNGVNLILDITALEEVWRRFLGELGYSLKEIKKFITGPAYFAWFYMANTFGIGGPLHNKWFADRTELARKNQLIMRKLGIHPVLQGYSGMVPIDIRNYDKDADIIEQGTWCAATRPPMLRTTSKSYKKYAELFYKCQRDVYGDYSFYYSTDPFHEGGKTADMKPCEISHEILSEMLNFDRNAVWVVQSWQSNPTSEFLKGITDVKHGKEHTLILDLYAEKDPNYLKGKKANPNHGYDIEFNHTPWIYCMLNNFGGRLGLHGHLDNLVNNIPNVFNNTQNNLGIGISPEASENNPLLYDLFFEAIWQDNAYDDLKKINVDEWLKNYSIRRYGAESKAAIKALKILKETVYKAELNMLGQGAPECILNSRPGFEIKAASTWGNAKIGYNPKELKTALEYMKQDYDLLKHSEGYAYDLTSINLQVLANEMIPYHQRLKICFENKDIDGFKKCSDNILNLAEQMEAEADKCKYYRLDTMIDKAKKLSANTDDFTKRLYIINANAQITTWGEYTRSELGLLHDYSNRTWSGLINDFYKPRWERWLMARINELEGKAFEKDINWFEWEWNWVLNSF